jgi:hypothetical protein
MFTEKVILIIACVIAWIMLLLPSLIYLSTEWLARRDRLFGHLNDKALALYFKRFFPSRSMPSNVKDQFEREFTRLYGRKQYIIPLVLLAAISGAGMWATARTIMSWLGLIEEAFALSPIVIASFLGAYTWVLLDQLSRYQSRDFTKHNIYEGVFRFLVAIPLGFSFAALLREDLGIPLAFLLGSFPTQTLMKFSRRLVVERLGLGEKEKDGPTELAKLQGIGRENAERFQHVDITTIMQLAWADPIDLTIRTNFDFNYLIDCISQALMWIYFEEQTRELYRLSLRGSQEVRWLLRAIESDDKNERARGEKTLHETAGVLKMDNQSLMHTLCAISEDPYTEFIVNVWAPEKH